MRQRGQWNIMSMDLVRLGEMVLLVTLMVVELSYWMGDCPWGHFISISFCHRDTVYLVVIKYQLFKPQQHRT